MKRDVATIGMVLFLAACVLGSFGGAAAAEKGADEWKFMVAPYGWGTAIGADVNRGDRGMSTHMSMGDVVDALDFAFFLHAEAQKGQWGIYTDFIYANLGENGTLQLPGPIEVGASVKLKEYVFEFGGMYTIEQGKHNIDILYGGRYFYIMTKGGIGNQYTRISKDWIDPVVGARYRTELSDKWAFSFRGDVAGFSVGSEFTWHLNSIFTYELRENIDLALGYRYMNVNYNGSTNIDLEIYGPIIGAVFKF